MGALLHTPAPPPPLLLQETVNEEKPTTVIPSVRTASGEKTGAERVNPYNDNSPKSRQVEEMFDSIAPAYDFMNTAMTFGLHRYWRDRALRMARKELGESAENADFTILDVATGTGDVAFRMASLFPQARIHGVDLSSGMLRIASEKLDHRSDLKERMQFSVGDCLNLEAPDESYSMVTVAYGVRNFERLADGYREMHRVLRHGGVLCVIELSCPVAPLTRTLYNIYSRHVIPAIGRMVSGDSRAYTYLPESIAAAPQRDDMTRLMSDAGFTHTKWRSLTMGAVTIYIAHKA